MDLASNWKTSCDIGIQVETPTTREIGVQVDIQVTELPLEDLKNKIHVLQIQIRDLQEQLDYAYNYVIESWKHNQELKKINQLLIEQNNTMVYDWETQLGSQTERINAIIEIAKRERQNVYNDIESLILNKQRFSLNNLLDFTPQSWLIKRNPVIVNFIETLTHNNPNPNDPNL